MIDDQTIGIGIVTYSRKDSYAQLICKIKQIEHVDYVVTVKNFNVDYADADPKAICNGTNGKQQLFSFQVNEKLGIAYNKNLAVKKLLQCNAQHIFVIEDDISIKDPGVFKEYIETAREFSLEHLNFCRSFDTMITHDYVKPICSISSKTKKLDIFTRLSGDFSYFTANALKKAGLYDDRYINAFDHVEHTYRMSVLGFYSPFYAFADIADSTKYLEDCGTTTTIVHDEEYQKNFKYGGMLFTKTYGMALNEIKPPTRQRLIEFFNMKQQKLA